MVALFIPGGLRGSNTLEGGGPQKRDIKLKVQNLKRSNQKVKMSKLKKVKSKSQTDQIKKLRCQKSKAPGKKTSQNFEPVPVA